VAQGDFLKALGIEARAAALIRANPAAAGTVARALHRLTDDTAMGRLFKMFAITPLASAPPPGF
jgi:NADH dehydrogenase [ubiquinone] 1 alpha subcomplex assembly factor 7